MKKALSLFISLSIALCCFAQTPKRITVNEASIVKDSVGNQYPYVIWQKLLAEGNYTVRAINPAQDDTEFLLVKLTEQQKTLLVNRMPKPAESKFFTTGQTLKPFSVKDITGKKVDAKDWAGKTIVLNFWFIGCPPCRAEIPELNKLVAKYSNNPNVIFIGIALDDGYPIKDFTRASPFDYRLVAEGKYYAKLFNINLFPTNVVIDKHGKVLFHGSGLAPNTPYWIDKTIQESDQATL